MDCGSRIHSTLKRCPWAPITYDQQVGSNDKRTVMQLGGIPTLKLKHATLKSQTGIGIGTKLTVGAYRNGMGSICMLMSTEYHDNHWDIIPRHPIDLELYKGDKMSLHKKRFYVS